MNETNEYLESLLPKRSDEVSEIEQFAKDHDVPIMEPSAIAVLLQLLTLKKPGKILEIGAAIGYSSIRMAQTLPYTSIITIERDEQRYEEAMSNIQKLNLEGRISLIKGDALELYEIVKMNAPYDVLFIDAAKGQYKRFFELYEPLLSQSGMIVTDNVLFKGLVAGSIDHIESRRVRSLIKKIRHYNEWLNAHPDYQTTILPIGDGIAVSLKRGEER
ncbi:O-methyltransferase [Metabacillus arenae]|uniref:tRNA 5-hydroxyuridine methyltransferase n=1 Tax=Metabacillus arenae TaxID=2771434 RepID=A0A926NJR5_9BACI|nr:O-methyltransferase [Metabacillus arenae]MBD1382050.1 O-methyltransferase [Metabacillus arenae]